MIAVQVDEELLGAGTAVVEVIEDRVEEGMPPPFLVYLVLTEGDEQGGETVRGKNAADFPVNGRELAVKPVPGLLQTETGGKAPGDENLPEPQITQPEQGLAQGHAVQAAVPKVLDEGSAEHGLFPGQLIFTVVGGPGQTEDIADRIDGLILEDWRNVGSEFRVTEKGGITIIHPERPPRGPEHCRPQFPPGEDRGAPSQHLPATVEFPATGEDIPPGYGAAVSSRGRSGDLSPGTMAQPAEGQGSGQPQQRQMKKTTEQDPPETARGHTIASGQHSQPVFMNP